MNQFTTDPIGRLPLSRGLDDSIFKMGKRTKEEIKKLCGWFVSKAVDNPGVTQYRYHEENDMVSEKQCRNSWMKAIKKHLKHTDNNSNIPWMWIQLKHESESLDAAKKWLNDNFDSITKMYTIYTGE